jgi:sulfide:quinone oxidoreductase
MAEAGTPLRVLIAGGGVAALEATLALRTLAIDAVSIELVAPEEDFTYRPLAVAEPFHVGEMRRFPLRQLVEAAGAGYTRGALAGVAPDRRVATLSDGQELSYDVLLLALGARPREAVTNAITFRGPQDRARMVDLLERASAGTLRRIVFAVPAAVWWPLPLYELALLTADYLVDRGTRGVDITLVTPEESPLALFGGEASHAVRELLESRGIHVETRVAPVRLDEGELQLLPDRRIKADEVVALAQLEGAPPIGVPHDGAGFVPTDAHGHVAGLDRVYAAGDLTQFPIKQGGIAAQQADAAAEAIAAEAGVALEPAPFRPVLRGLLLTGSFPRYLLSEPGRPRSVVDTEPLWWPPAKIVGRYLSPFLAVQLGLSVGPADAEFEDAVRVEVEVDLEPGAQVVPTAFPHAIR